MFSDNRLFDELMTNINLGGTQGHGPGEARVVDLVGDVDAAYVVIIHVNLPFSSQQHA